MRRQPLQGLRLSVTPGFGLVPPPCRGVRPTPEVLVLILVAMTGEIFTEWGRFVQVSACCQHGPDHKVWF